MQDAWSSREVGDELRVVPPADECKRARRHILQAELVLDDEITAIVTGVDGHVWIFLLISMFC
jgi:hypothetical protein